VIKRRKRRNTLNIYLTFWAWLAQFTTNLVCLVLVSFFFGTHVFLHSLLALLNLTLNFTVLPIFYIVMADETIKSVLVGKFKS
jgi:hypothetical protein